MRIKHKEEVKLGTIRVLNGFLLLPKRIGNETRWLEDAIWEETKTIGWTPHGGSSKEWQAIKWKN